MTTRFTMRLVLAEVLMLALRNAAGDGVLRNDQLKVSLSETTGQAVGLSDDQGNVYLARNADQYDLEGRVSTEEKDEVVRKTATKDAATFECLNRDLDLKIEKTYRLKDGRLEKSARYTREGQAKLLLKVSSETLLTPDFVTGGYYYLPTDDGSKVWTIPYIAGDQIKSRASWPIEGGNGLIYYAPKADRVFVHHPRKVNGWYIHIHPILGVASSIVPGGAITGMGQAFIAGTNSLTLDSEFVLLAGDPRDYHRYVLNQPPCVAYRNGKTPSWFKKVRMFMSDGMSSTGRGLMEDPQSVVKDVSSFLKLLKDDEYLMVFFNHWATSGDYPYSGTFRYHTYSDKGWSQPVPVEQLRENIKSLKAVSPRVKVGGYVFLSPTESSRPYQEHPEWLVCDPNGVPTLGGDGISKAGVPDFSTGLREYVLDQMTHMIADTGFDWIHMDYGPFETVNWKTRTVCQNGQAAEMYSQIGKILEDHDAALIENGAPSVALWAHGSYFEVAQPDRWEKKDWRVLAVPGYLATLYRTNRPGTWVNNCYGTLNIHAIRSAFSGMRGWIRGPCNWWQDVSHSLAHEKAIEELLETRAADVDVSPSWWKLETDRLETLALEKADALIVSLLLHGEQEREERISIKTEQLRRAEIGLDDKSYTFAFDLRLSAPTPVNVFEPVPWKSDYMELLGFEAMPRLHESYVHAFRLEPRRNFYHVLTQVPAWVYAVEGERASFLLPNNHDVSIRGRLAAGAKDYRLEVLNPHKSVQILAYVPDAWKGIAAALNGKPIRPARVRVLGQDFVRIDVPGGPSVIALSKAPAAAWEILPSGVYENPFALVWQEAAQRLMYQGLTHRAFAEDGRSCLGLKSAPGGGTVSFYIWPKSEAEGISLALRGGMTGGKIVATVHAGGAWTGEIVDDFTGWKEFRFTRDQLRAVGKDQTWGAVNSLTLSLTPVSTNVEMVLANVTLLPAKAGAMAKEHTRKRAVARRITVPPVIDGLGTDTCWEECPMIDDFQSLQGGPTESKTRVRLCYDDVNLYVFFENVEPIGKLAPPSNRDDQVWTTDHVELEVDPSGNGSRWYHLIVDTGGTIEDFENTDLGRNPAWNGKLEVKTALNWQAGWTAEYKIPFTDFAEHPKDGDVWRINFARMDAGSEWSTWTTGELLDPAGFGELLFGGQGGVAVSAGPAAPAGTNLLFHCSFDGATEPTVGKGPARLSTPAEYVPGLKGKAIVTSHTRNVFYPITDNIQADKGTILFWVKPLDWNRRDDGFHHFLTLPGTEEQSKQNLFTLILYRFQNWDSITAFAVRDATGPKLLNVDMDDAWDPGKDWHQIAFAWDAESAALYVDDKPPVVQESSSPAPTAFAGSEFQIGGPYFEANATQTAVDELSIYASKLSADDVRALFLAGAQRP